MSYIIKKGDYTYVNRTNPLEETYERYPASRFVFTLRTNQPKIFQTETEARSYANHYMKHIPVSIHPYKLHRTKPEVFEKETSDFRPTSTMKYYPMYTNLKGIQIEKAVMSYIKRYCKSEDSTNQFIINFELDEKDVQMIREGENQPSFIYEEIYSKIIQKKRENDGVLEWLWKNSF